MRPVTRQLVAGAVIVQVLVESPTVATVYVSGVGPAEGAVAVIVTDASPATTVGAAGGRRKYACGRPWYVDVMSGQLVALAKR